MALEIDRMLVLSTGHLTEETCNTWLKEVCPWACFEKGEFGWFVYVPDDIPEGVPLSLMDCLDLAADLGVHWIMFDQDVPQINILTYYEW